MKHFLELRTFPLPRSPLESPFSRVCLPGMMHGFDLTSPRPWFVVFIAGQMKNFYCYRRPSENSRVILFITIVWQRLGFFSLDSEQKVSRTNAWPRRKKVWYSWNLFNKFTVGVRDTIKIEKGNSARVCKAAYPLNLISTRNYCVSKWFRYGHSGGRLKKS